MPNYMVSFPSPALNCAAITFSSSFNNFSRNFAECRTDSVKSISRYLLYVYRMRLVWLICLYFPALCAEAPEPHLSPKPGSLWLLSPASSSMQICRAHFSIAPLIFFRKASCARAGLHPPKTTQQRARLSPDALLLLLFDSMFSNMQVHRPVTRTNRTYQSTTSPPGAEFASDHSRSSCAQSRSASLSVHSSISSPSSVIQL